MRILLASEGSARRVWGEELRRQGFVVDVARVPDDVLVHLWVDASDLVIIDLRWLVDTGLLLDDFEGKAVIVVTEPGAHEDRLRVLAEGVDDVVTPPVLTEELVLRVAKALVRRTEPDGLSLVRIGPVAFDRVSREVVCRGAPVHLTPTALCVFDHLVAHRHRLVPQAELLEHCWRTRSEELSNPLPSQIYRLRRVFSGDLRFRHVDRGGFQVEPDDSWSGDDEGSS